MKLSESALRRLVRESLNQRVLLENEEEGSSPDVSSMSNKERITYFQELIKKALDGDGADVEDFKVDGQWGKTTQAKWEQWLASKAGFIESIEGMPSAADIKSNWAKNSGEYDPNIVGIINFIQDVEAENKSKLAAEMAAAEEEAEDERVKKEFGLVAYNFWQELSGERTYSPSDTDVEIVIDAVANENWSAIGSVDKRANFKVTNAATKVYKGSGEESIYYTDVPTEVTFKVGYKNSGPEYAIRCRPWWGSMQSSKRGPSLLVRVLAAGVKNSKHTDFVGSKETTLRGLMRSKDDVVASWSGSFDKDRYAGNQKQLTKGCIAYLALETWLKGVPKSAAKEWYDQMGQKGLAWYDSDSQDYAIDTGIPT